MRCYRVYFHVCGSSALTRPYALFTAMALEIDRCVAAWATWSAADLFGGSLRASLAWPSGAAANRPNVRPDVLELAAALTLLLALHASNMITGRGLPHGDMTRNAASPPVCFRGPSRWSVDRQLLAVAATGSGWLTHSWLISGMRLGIGLVLEAIQASTGSFEMGVHLHVSGGGIGESRLLSMAVAVLAVWSKNAAAPGSSEPRRSLDASTGCATVLVLVTASCFPSRVRERTPPRRRRPRVGPGPIWF